MTFTEAFRMAVASLRTNKLRSMLTLLGVIIGIAAVIAILTLGAAMKGQFSQDLDKVGINSISATVVERNTQDGSTTADAQDSSADLAYAATVTDPSAFLTTDMLDKVRTHMGADISGIIIGEYSSYTGEITAASAEKVNANLQPTNADYITASHYTIVAGRSLTTEDVEASRPVAVISQDLATELFAHGGNSAEGAAGGEAQAASASEAAASAAAATAAQYAIGQEVDFESEGHIVSLTIVGVYSPPQTGPLIGGQATNYALVPYPLESAVSTSPAAGTAFSSVTIRAAQGADKQAVAAKLQATFDALYADNPDYRVKISDFSKELASFNQIITMMSLVVAAIGGISLLVGGIGVMNIMLITVTERTQEIGVRKALGARRRDIRVQFVVEAIIVCLFGGVLGVLLGSVIGMIGSKLLGFFVFPPLAAVVISLLFSVSIGLFFGSYPAGKAAKLDPIEALRH